MQGHDCSKVLGKQAKAVGHSSHLWGLWCLPGLGHQLWWPHNEKIHWCREVLGHAVSVFLGLTSGIAAFSVLGVRMMAILSGGYSSAVEIREALFSWGCTWGMSWGFELGRFCAVTVGMLWIVRWIGFDCSIIVGLVAIDVALVFFLS